MFTNFVLRLLLSQASFKDKPPLLTLEHNAINYLDAVTRTKHHITFPNDSGAYVAVDYDWKRNFVYLSKEDSKIYRIKFREFGMQGNAEVVLEDGTEFRFFSQWAIDWVHNKLYWVDVLKNYTLHVMDLSNRIQKTLGALNIGKSIMRRIYVNPFDKCIYYFTDKGIDRIGLDGTNIQTVLYNPIFSLYQIEPYMAIDNFNAYVPLQHRDEVQSVEDQTGVENNLIFENQQNEDYENKEIVYHEQGLHYFNLVNTNGTNNHEVLQLYFAGVNNAKVLQVYQNNIYFLETKNFLDVFRKYDLRSETLTEEKTNSVWGDYKIFHPFAQPLGNDPCSPGNGGCSHLCLSKSLNEYTCECPDNWTKHNNTCSQL